MDVFRKMAKALQKFMEFLIELFFGLGLLYLIFISFQNPKVPQISDSNIPSFTEICSRPQYEMISRQERRIARHFEIDTLPGLMQRGLIKKYERRSIGTLLLVEGKIWKNR